MTVQKVLALRSAVLPNKAMLVVDSKMTWIPSTLLVGSANGEARVMTISNYEQLFAEYEVVFINFYADWCRFSQILQPIFDEAAVKLEAEFPGKVLLAKVDCDAQTTLAGKFHITKYPTLKTVRNGSMLKREYRKSRSIEAMTQYIREMLKDHVKESTPFDLSKDVDEAKSALIGYFQSKNSTAYEVFRRLAADMHDECNFYFVAREPQGDEPKDRIRFKEARNKYDAVRSLEYTGSVVDFDKIKEWSQEKCVPLVREITFENAEELTEEGLPFLILFHHPGDKTSVAEFSQLVKNELITEKTSVNFLIADGVKFAHPLHHLGKSVKDLPVIAIDSFRHMYIFPRYGDIHTPGRLMQFIKDLFSGKLHREFHYGPDDPIVNAVQTDPPESTFRKLAPSSNRYTLLRDEL
ncbi:endoplasmic reticulum resident protein 44-like isoform X2 [Varroa jacobsoni]|uniref:Thioredoxin domain-containing protein n=1 Tax=Varroa destructor TaxID=109461 RepID=A0A7M7MAZ0_VARDE|nr:endoplasmic reticulum resident protein 44-like isoform X2 [Varroa destructor]XP_022699032.1 endoplasmic reticulum resident protein 44-like isoform X2 [Varroa jacobsoni]